MASRSCSERVQDLPTENASQFSLVMSLANLLNLFWKNQPKDLGVSNQKVKLQKRLPNVVMQLSTYSSVEHGHCPRVFILLFAESRDPDDDAGTFGVPAEDNDGGSYYVCDCLSNLKVSNGPGLVGTNSFGYTARLYIEGMSHICTVTSLSV